MPDQTPATLWRSTLSELELEMTSATYNTWFRDTAGLVLDGDTLTVACRNQYALEWLENRMIQVVNRAVRGVSGNDNLVVHFQIAPTLPTAPASSHVPSAEFPGFGRPKHWHRRIPLEFFEHLLPDPNVPVKLVVLTICAYTVGNIPNSLKWWEASNSEIALACGLKRETVNRALTKAAAAGYIIRERGKKYFKYALRGLGEPVDNFEETVDN